MYPDLIPILSHAKSLGVYTTVTTNGFFCHTRLLERLRGIVDALALSIDGPANIHNAIRGSVRAFDQLETGLRAVRTSHIPFGLIHTVSRQSWEHLLWVAAFAVASGARLLQIHPLEIAGRASSEMTDDVLDEDLLAKIYLAVAALVAKYDNVMKVQLDAVYREDLRNEPALVYAEPAAETSDAYAPARHVGVLVLEPDGTVVPVAYGFARDYALCNVKKLRLLECWPQYVTQRYPAFLSLCRRVWEQLCSPNAPILSNWHEVIVSSSHSLRLTRATRA